MDVLVIGGGGREHALVWALARSPSITRLACAPGNAGIAATAECWDIKPGDLHGIVRAAADEGIDLIVVGPEAPLTSGIADLAAREGILCFGPSRAAAIIEGSKAFAKAFMRRHGIPTARFEVFSDAAAARSWVEASELGFPVVVKADGLAAGKGVVVCEDLPQAAAAIDAAMVQGAFGKAGSTVVIEEFLRGVEVSVMALSDGTRVVPLLPSQDHKQALDGDRGPNTGGMGAYAPADMLLDDAALQQVCDTILRPTIAGLAAEERVFVGLLYAGLMLTDAGPRVLEFNCRFGDPETQAVLPLLDQDVGELLAAVADGGLADEPLRWRDAAAACVILAAAGYPGKYRHGDTIHGLDQLDDREDILVFHAGTAREGDRIVTSGGRVLGITGIGANLEQAIARAYAGVAEVRFEGMHFRRDIGRRPEVHT